MRIDWDPEQAWGPQREGWPRYLLGVRGGPGYFKVGVSQAPSTPVSSRLVGKTVLGTGGDWKKGEEPWGGEWNSGFCWREKLGGLCCKERFLGWRWASETHRTLRNSPESREA